ncbi:MAG: hypothetical protein HC905_22455 [Bacteroidales bacterium]|nr:hypothetical protein [Bacteroidales bacterium]
MKNITFCLIGITMLLASCKKENNVIIPELQISGTEVTEGNSATTLATITVTLSEPTSGEISFTVSTEDGTAKDGLEYEAISSMEIKIAAGETSKKIEIQIMADEFLEFNKYFKVKVDNVVGATVLNNSAFVNILDNDTYTPVSDAEGVITPDTYPGMSLVWSDEFTDAQLNTAYWKYEKGAGGWGNNELQNYSDSQNNVFLQDGKLNIKPIKEGSGYTSGRIITSGKKEFKYGRIDIRAKLPYGKRNLASFVDAW